ncbi:MAG: DUF721 domain-containing protein [Tatlockia sp.]|nr:DUF721 domain-containing protein [Tatlockia sp.]
MRSINRCLNAQLLNICQRSIQLDELNCKIKATLPAPLNNYCQVAAFNSGCLLISATNAAWATELRYRMPELRDKLRKAGLYQLSSIKISLAEFDPQLPQEKLLVKKSLSTSARKNIRKAGELCSYQPLRDALYHLAAESE